MSKLVHMRTRIQTIETIRKLTDAMRIISMSAHSRLKHQQEPLERYVNAIEVLLAKIDHALPEWSHERLLPAETADSQALVIVIGTQKGLCGSFNNQLFKFFETQARLENKTTEYHYALIGKKVIDYMKKEHSLHTVMYRHETLHFNTIFAIAQDLINLIMTSKKIYTRVSIISNTFKTFFIQKPTRTELIPLQKKNISPLVKTPTEGYLWDEEPHAIYNQLATLSIEVQLQQLLFQSLLAEQSARFISMDNSTRNAINLLDSTKREYNKLRQTKITTEITELSGNF